MDESRRRQRPYFIWDYDVTEDEVHAILKGDNEDQKAWLIGRILEAARWEDIWKYVTVDEVRRYFDRLRMRPFQREIWEYVLEVWSRRDSPGKLGEPAPICDVPKPQPRLEPGVLTPLQHAFLTRFFASPGGSQFFLTGGTALAAFYFHHRLSDDLDLFTLDDEALDLIVPVLHDVGRDLQLLAEDVRLSPCFLRFVLREKPDRGPALKADLVREFGPQYGEPHWVAGIRVDALENIAANKVTAILGRGEMKDFVDLYFLVQAGFDFLTLVDMAREKDPGLTEFYLLGMLRQVERDVPLPVMLKPLDRDSLVDAMAQLAEVLAQRIDPRHNTSV